MFPRMQEMISVIPAWLITDVCLCVTMLQPVSIVAVEWDVNWAAPLLSWI